MQLSKPVLCSLGPFRVSRIFTGSKGEQQKSIGEWWKRKWGGDKRGNGRLGKKDGKSCKCDMKGRRGGLK